MTISDFKQFGAKNSEAGALKNALTHIGITAPHSGEPFSEELLFGIGGGIGFAYFLFEKQGSHPVHLGTRIHTKETERPEFLQTICKRIGVPVHVQNSSSATAAWANLTRNLEQGRAPIAWVDFSRLPYLGHHTPATTHYNVIVYGIDPESDRILLADRSPQPMHLTRDEFRLARETSWSPKYRAMLVQRPSAPADFRAGVEEGIRDCYRQMEDGLGITNFGLRGLEKWATILTSSKEKKSWQKMFPPGRGLYDVLFSMYNQIATRGAGGSAQRNLYAEFLNEAAAILSNPSLRDVADQFRASEQMWTELADAHLPDHVPLFAEARRLSQRRNVLFESRGMDAAEEIAQTRQRLEQIADQVGQEFPMSANDARGLLGDIRQCILKVREHEAEAVQALASSMAIDHEHVA